MNPTQPLSLASARLQRVLLIDNWSRVTDVRKHGGQGDNGPHFNLARPGEATDRLMQVVAEWLKQQGVE